MSADSYNYVIFDKDAKAECTEYKEHLQQVVLEALHVHVQKNGIRASSIITHTQKKNSAKWIQYLTMKPETARGKYRHSHYVIQV